MLCSMTFDQSNMTTNHLQTCHSDLLRSKLPSECYKNEFDLMEAEFIQKVEKVIDGEGKVRFFCILCERGFKNYKLAESHINHQHIMS